MAALETFPPEDQLIWSNLLVLIAGTGKLKLFSKYQMLFLQALK